MICFKASLVVIFLLDQSVPLKLLVPSLGRVDFSESSVFVLAVFLDSWVCLFCGMNLQSL